MDIQFQSQQIFEAYFTIFAIRPGHSDYGQILCASIRMIKETGGLEWLMMKIHEAPFRTAMYPRTPSEEV